MSEAVLPDDAVAVESPEEAQADRPVEGALEVDAKQAAVRILQWAKENHLLSRPAMEESVEEVEADQDVVPQQAFASTSVREIMHRRAINMVGYSQPGRKVIIFTKGRINAAEEKVLPKLEDGIAYEYVQGGIAQVKGNAPLSTMPRPYFEHNGRYCCGSSIFPANCIGAGTFGLLARDAQGVLFGVSNNHVAGACNHAQPGLPILAPGPLDVSSDHRDPFTIGRHNRLLPINDGIPENVDISVNWDACCFEIVDPASVSSMQGNRFDTPTVVEDPVPGMHVEKIGRTTGYTGGVILAQSASPLPVAYAVAEFGIKKSVFFETVYVVQGLAGAFSSPGDSGSLVTHMRGTERIAVGLVFAGDAVRGWSFILPLRPLLDKLALEIVGSHNV